MSHPHTTIDEQQGFPISDEHDRTFPFYIRAGASQNDQSTVPALFTSNSYRRALGNNQSDSDQILSKQYCSSQYLEPYRMFIDHRAILLLEIPQPNPKMVPLFWNTMHCDMDLGKPVFQEWIC